MRETVDSNVEVVAGTAIGAIEHRDLNDSTQRRVKQKTGPKPCRSHCTRLKCGQRILSAPSCRRYAYVHPHAHRTHVGGDADKVQAGSTRSVRSTRSRRCSSNHLICAQDEFTPPPTRPTPPDHLPFYLCCAVGAKRSKSTIPPAEKLQRLSLSLPPPLSQHATSSAHSVGAENTQEMEM